MKLSIIVPVYNMAADGKLDFCLKSLVAQTLDPADYEILAVDDFSTDDSLQILRDYEERYPQFHAIASDRNRHQGGAKNLGLARAKGEWLGFIDADDWIVPDYYERLLQKAAESGADMVGCDYTLTEEHSFRPGRQIAENLPEQCGVLDHERRRLLLLESGSLVVKIYRRSIILGDYVPGTKERLDVFPEDIFYEDNAVRNSWMLRAKHFEYIPEALYYYYQHPGSTVHTVSLKNLEDRCTAGRLMLAEAKDGGYFEDYRDEIEFLFIVLFYKNTLFSAMPRQRGLKKGCYGFTKKLAREMKELFPDFQKNPYYIEKVHPEERKLIRFQMHSQLFFYLYYRLLWFYRDLRKKGKA
ncbi:MAG: glycosyltransferase [Lachnospiraceae bacterium]|nr:glycosyltransferase [Lachnospiraceae bacterium]